MAAPFFNDAEGLRPIAYDSWWKDVAGGARLDILALQDGIGVGHAKLNDVGEWFRGMSEELANTGCVLWSDLETFATESNGTDGAASVSRVAKQVAAEGVYVERLTTFAFTHYDCPQQRRDAEFAEWKGMRRGCPATQ